MRAPGATGAAASGGSAEGGGPGDDIPQPRILRQSGPGGAETARYRALIVAHGQPSDPGPAEAALAEFAAQVAAALPGGWQVAAATLAAPGALEAALDALAGTADTAEPTAPLLIYPMFIADGWFTQVNLPARLRAAGLVLDEAGASAGEDGVRSSAVSGGADPRAAQARSSGRPVIAGLAASFRDTEAGEAEPDGAAGAGCGIEGVAGADGNPGADRNCDAGGLGEVGAGAVGAGGARPGASGADGAAGAAAGRVAPGAAHLTGPVPGRSAARILPPFGLDPQILPLALQVLAVALEEAGLRAAETRLIVAAHGSFKSPAPAAVARRLARLIIATLPFAEMRTAFIDQAPRIAESARDLPAPALCLPLFAAAGGHVEEDLPAALAEAGFSGRTLAPLGLAPEAPALVAAALRAAAEG